MYALAAQSAGNKLGSTDFSICSNIRWILYVIHAPTEKRAEESPGDDRRDGSR